VTPLAQAARGHLARLADALADLKHRVRVAVAAEAAAAVADTMRQVLTAALAPSDRANRPESGRPTRDGWDDPDGWGADDGDGGFDDAESDPARPAPVPPPEPARRPWTTAALTGVAVTRWLLVRPTAVWLAVAAGAMTAGTALVGGVAGRIGLAAADLLDLARPTAGGVWN